MSLATETKTTTWMSVFSTLSDDNIPPGSLSISVIMEAGLGPQYAGIQLILVWVAFGHDIRPLQRPRLNQPFGVRDSAGIRNRSRPSSQLPFCTVVLGIEFRQERVHRTRTRIVYSVEPMSQATAPRTDSWWDPILEPQRPKPIGILFDSHIPWRTRALDDSHAYSIEISFGRMNYDKYEPCPYTRGRSVAVHISACNSSRKKYPIFLPPGVMLRIGISLTNPSHILAAALVAKSWFHIMKGFFRNLGWFGSCYIKHLDNFAEALQKHAEEWGPHITALNIRHQRLLQNPRFYVHDFCEIIKCAPNLRVLNINLLVLTRAKNHILRLKYLEEIICSSYAILEKGQIPEYLISVEEILQTISTMSRLQRTVLSGVGRSKPCGDAAPSEPPIFQLISLDLERENISSPQLEYLVSSPNQLPRLQVLNLYKVGGFSPEVLSRFLSKVAPTLCSLRIVDCDAAVIRKEDNKSVLDGVIGRMDCLTAVELRGRVFTPTVVSSTPKTPGEICIYAKRNLITDNGLDVMTTLHQCSVIKWSKITVRLIDTTDETMVDMRKEAKRLAQAKGFEIVFILSWSE